MQKKLIALAVAGLVSGTAFAQSNVSIYGVADVYYAHVSSSGNPSANAINSGGLAGSRIGFKGVEDLGNGTKALFVLEYALNIDGNSGIGNDFSPRSGTNNAWGPGYNTNQTGTNNSARQQIIGLTGGWGTAAAGYAQTAGYDFACAVDPLAGSALDTSSRLPGTMLLTCGKPGRANNAVAYISPSFSGFSFAVNYAAGEDPSSTTSADNAYLLAANYANGPLDVKFVYSKATINSNGNITTGTIYSNAVTNAALFSGSSVKEWGLGGSYDFGAAKLFASYQTLDAHGVVALNGSDVTGGNDKLYQIGVKVPLGAGALIGSYAKVKMGELDGNTSLGLSGKKFDDSAWSIAYAYGLSKRTTLYTGYNRYSNDSNSTRAATQGLSLPAANAGGNTGTFAVGMNHTF